MEDRRQQLDLPAAGAELELPAAVRADVACGEPVVGVEQALEAAEARRLDVHHPRRERQRLDVGDAVDRGVPRDLVAVRLQERVDLRREPRVLVPGAGERGDDAAVQVRVGADVDDRPLVVALEVDAVDRAGGHEAGDDLVRPGRRRVELEAQRRVVRESLLQRLQRGRLAQAQRHHEGHRLRLAPQRLVQREPGLVEREVQRRGLVAPTPVAAVHVALQRAAGEEVQAADVLGERGDRPAAREGERRPGASSAASCSSAS